MLQNFFKMTTLFTKYTSNKTEDSEQELLTHIIRSFRKTQLKFAKPKRRFLARLVQDATQVSKLGLLLIRLLRCPRQTVAQLTEDAGLDNRRTKFV